ncbi:L-serine ammonia-lyase [Porphyromonas loveana]|uniref:L-serine dehydratase n=3 Tax=Porphyromonas loveana TaxID=1884669 RepID=A0A2U1FJ41_9PORP|nr:L-serine ammonia-lyase [Porphyromonas loveana]
MRRLHLQIWSLRHKHARTCSGYQTDTNNNNIIQQTIGMESITQIFRIGYGPSSSHTIGPRRAAEMFLERNPAAKSFRVTLYGSLAATGKGHLTDVAILAVLEPHAPTEIVWRADVVKPFHPNGILFESFDSAGKQLEEWLIYSIGGGVLANEHFNEQRGREVYPLNKMSDILDELNRRGLSFWEYVEENEGPEIWDYLSEVWEVMKNAIQEGLEAEGVLPGGLGVRRKAANYLIRAQGYTPGVRSRGNVYAYALAVSEQNASGGRIVTAPTCGSSGVIPAVLYHLQQTREFSDKRILRALATAGLFGNVVRTNASISGAEVGCQGEVGVACAMGAAASSQLFGGTLSQIEYAAEMALEHHLGLTCDPVCGLVQVPCIERNAFAAARALDANTYANFSDGRHRISFDQVVEVMRQTGKDLPSLYKETSQGGLAAVHC